ncbi:MAG: DinB family protein, partial [Anaerolineales bacterium]|nr:DinB family protein [Anaerolineales bacterium]
EEQLGSYAGRMWWAAAYSLLIGEARERGVPRDRGGALAEMDQVLGMLGDVDLDPELLAALERTRTLVGAGKTVGWEEFEHVLVCRHCGALSTGERQTDCPNCGAGWITRNTFQPIWFLEPLEPDDLLVALELTPTRIRSIMDGLAEASLRERPMPEEWSLREVLEHLWLAQGLMQGRIEHMLEEDRPNFAGVDVATAGSANDGTDGLLEEFDDRRSALLSTLSGLDREAWRRQGWHDEFGRITVQSQASYMARHEHYHLRQMREVRRSLSR